jgi:hypothetical protein
VDGIRCCPARMGGRDEVVTRDEPELEFGLSYLGFCTEKNTEVSSQHVMPRGEHV